MKNQIKAIVKMFYTKRDINGNVYWMALIMNTSNGKGFTTSACHNSNIVSILRKAGIDYNNMFEVSLCTDSAKLSSLPSSSQNLNECHYTKEWKTALYKIGFRNLNQPVER